MQSRAAGFRKTSSAAKRRVQNSIADARALTDSIQDREILAHQAATASQHAVLGIAGRPNRSRNDGTITRFGWKAQN